MKTIWALRGVQIRAEAGLGRHVATYMTDRHDGQLLAAAPRMLELLANACEVLDSMERCASSSSTADRIREELAGLCPIRWSEAVTKEQGE